MSAIKVFSFLLRIPTAYRLDLQNMAKDEGRSVNSMIVSILKKEIINYRKAKGEAQPDLFEFEYEPRKDAVKAAKQRAENKEQKD